ncbi:MAG: SCP2 sterol-binding domain-containing protein [Proteobacteria bacterium]|nr:SCP2 sterol-binding domain-containing protein [Pseudomonadota bacterium]
MVRAVAGIYGRALRCLIPGRVVRRMSAMPSSRHPAPPLSPVLLAGFVIRPPPAAMLQPFLGAAMRVMQRRHPGVFERLGLLDGALILIDPVDLPVCLAMEFAAGGPDLRVAGAGDEARASATVRGPLLSLIDLMEGRRDGDALFFSRELVIEGDTEAILILRNTIDGEDIDVIDDLTSSLGPFARPAAALAGAARTLFTHFARDLETLHDAILAPLAQRAAGQEMEVRRLEERIAELEKAARPRRPAGRARS